MSLFYLETHQQNLAHIGNTASSITIYQTKPNNHINVHQIQTQHIPIQHIKIHKYTNDMQIQSNQYITCTKTKQKGIFIIYFDK